MPFGELKNIPDFKERELAKAAKDKLNACLTSNVPSYEFEILKNGKKEKILIPNSALRFLFNVLNQMAQGNTPTIIPQHAQLTTQQAAIFLNVSRSFLIKLLEEDKIPYEKVGRHRRVKFDDLLKFKNQQLLKSEIAREKLAKESQDLNFGY